MKLDKAHCKTTSYLQAERGARAYSRGLNAEARAASYLGRRGFSILAQRYRTPLGEIDLVALKGTTLHIIEVKRRSTLSEAREAISLRQRRRIVQAAEVFLQEPPCAYEEVQFDALFLTEAQIDFLENAWRVEDVF